MNTTTATPERQAPVSLRGRDHGASGDRATSWADDPSTGAPPTPPDEGWRQRDKAPPLTSSLDEVDITLQEHDFIHIYCENCGTPKAVELKCNDRTCERCRRREYARLVAGYADAVKQVAAQGQHRLKFITLTVKNTSSLDGGVRVIKEALSKLRRRKRVKPLFEGGLYCFETPQASDGTWNVHVHIITQGLFVDQRILADQWASVTDGEGYIAWIEWVRVPRSAIKYLLKYLTKSPEIKTGEGLREFNQVWKGKRMVQPFGGWLGELVLSLPPMPCPECGCTDWMPEFWLVTAMREHMSFKGGGYG